MAGGDGSDLYVINSSTEHAAAEINDSGISGSDELRFAATIAGQTLTIGLGDIGLECISIGTGTAATAVTSATTALGVNAILAPNALLISGNAGNNTLLGSGFDDLLIGAGGLDSMNGGDGSDIYLIGIASDHGAAEINDSGVSGRDELRFAATTAGQTLRVFAADRGLERVCIGTGNGATANRSATTALSIDASLAPNALLISGNAGANRLSGSAFNDTLIGGEGVDSLTGGLGADCFQFDTAINPSMSPDRLIDFNPAQADWLALDSTVFGELGPVGPLASAAFSIGSSFTDIAQRILYNPVNGALTYDSDGSAGLGFVATFAVLPVGLGAQLSSIAFMVI
jgi:Ca2+-binding RTX toxin-like protein